MRTACSTSVALCMVAAVALSAGPLTGATPAGEHYVVVLQDPGGAEAVAVAAGVKVQRIFRSALNGFVARLSPANVETLRADPRVAYVAPDGPVHLLAESTPSGVSRVGASASAAADGSAPASGGPKAAIAIVDTGIASHPELNVLGGMSCEDNPVGNRIAEVMGRATFSDDNGHGTHVSGTVAARADGRGVVGVSPGSPLYAVRVLGGLGSGSLSDVICGLDWVAANAAEKNIKVVNMSLGARGTDDGACGAKVGDPLHEAVCRVVGKGVTIVAAAGNSGEDFGATVPAAYNEVLTVTAMADFDGLPGGRSSPSCDENERDDTAAGFSNFALGDDILHTVAAPGVCVNSTWNDGGYRMLSGTSMASPHVAGLVARCIDARACAGLAPAQIAAKIRSVAAARPAGTGFFGDPRMPIRSRYYGHLVSSGTF